MSIAINSIPAQEIRFFVADLPTSANVSITTTAGYSLLPWQPTMVATDVDQLEFSALADQWKKETGHLSSRTQKISSPLYRRIMQMGRDRAVPQIIKQLQAEGRTPNHWWNALEELTGENPVPENSRHDIRLAAQAWIQWGREHYAGQLGPEDIP